MAAAPKTGFSTAFALPDDFLYAIKGDTSSQYSIYGNEIHCNVPTFRLDYVTRVAEDLIPAYFAKALEFNLAALFAVPLTGDTKKGDYYSKLFLDAVKKAKFADSTQYPEVPVQSTPYTLARY